MSGMDAIREARADERRRCVELVEAAARDEMDDHVAIDLRALAERLRALPPVADEVPPALTAERNFIRAWERRRFARALESAIRDERKNGDEAGYGETVLGVLTDAFRAMGCANGCNAYPHSPSKVLCKECFAKLDQAMRALVKT